MEAKQVIGKLYNLKSFVDATIQMVNMGTIDPDAAIVTVKKVASEIDQQRGGREPGQEG